MAKKKTDKEIVWDKLKHVKQINKIAGMDVTAPTLTIAKDWVNSVLKRRNNNERD